MAKVTKLRGAAIPRRGARGERRSIRVTDGNWSAWKAAAELERKSVAAWLHDLAADRLDVLRDIDARRRAAE